MNSVQKELVKYIEDILNLRYSTWQVEVAPNVFNHKWAVLFIEKTDVWVHRVGWFFFDKLNEEDDAFYIVKEVIRQMDGGENG